MWKQNQRESGIYKNNHYTNAFGLKRWNQIQNMEHTEDTENTKRGNTNFPKEKVQNAVLCKVV